MLYIVIFFLGASLWLYLLFGGADFGAGVLALFTRKKNQAASREHLYQAMGPVWEANHIWLILAVVILFVGFPSVYAAVSTHLHIPLLIILLGIIFRGTAFVFQHYDAVQDGWQRTYDRVFVYSSLITPFFLGVVSGTVISGRLQPLGGSFAETFVLPWLAPFPLATGIFTTLIAAFLAAVFLAGETSDTYHRRRYVAKARLIQGLMVVAGGAIFVVTGTVGQALLARFAISWPSWVFVAIATIMIPLLWRSLANGQTALSRIWAGAQVTFILLGIIWNQFPIILSFSDGTALTVWNAHAPEPALKALTIALFVGSVSIFPAFFFLLRTFSKRPKPFLNQSVKKDAENH